MTKRLMLVFAFVLPLLAPLHGQKPERPSMRCDHVFKLSYPNNTDGRISSIPVGEVCGNFPLEPLVGDERGVWEFTNALKAAGYEVERIGGRP